MSMRNRSPPAPFPGWLPRRRRRQRPLGDLRLAAPRARIVLGRIDGRAVHRQARIAAQIASLQRVRASTRTGSRRARSELDAADPRRAVRPQRRHRLVLAHVEASRTRCANSGASACDLIPARHDRTACRTALTTVRTRRPAIRAGAIATTSAISDPPATRRRSAHRAPATTTRDATGGGARRRRRLGRRLGRRCSDAAGSLGIATAKTAEPDMFGVDDQPVDRRSSMPSPCGCCGQGDVRRLRPRSARATSPPRTGQR